MIGAARTYQHLMNGCGTINQLRTSLREDLLEKEGKEFFEALNAIQHLDHLYSVLHIAALAEMSKPDWRLL